MRIRRTIFFGNSTQRKPCLFRIKNTHVPFFDLSFCAMNLTFMQNESSIGTEVAFYPLDCTKLELDSFIKDAVCHDPKSLAMDK